MTASLGCVSSESVVGPETEVAKALRLEDLANSLAGGSSLGNELWASSIRGQHGSQMIVSSNPGGDGGFYRRYMEIREKQ